MTDWDPDWIELGDTVHPAETPLVSYCQLCTCHQPERIEQRLWDLLTATRRPNSYPGDIHLLDWDPTTWDDADYLAALTLDTHGLVDHGSSIIGSWLTHTGADIIKAIHTHTQQNGEGAPNTPPTI